MKYILYTLISFGLFSCDKVEDHYRISGVSIQVGNISAGPNPHCINIGNEADSTYEEYIGIQIEFIREYYSTDSSRTSGLMYSPKGWEGCAEKISMLELISESINISKLLFGDTTITGVDKGKLTSIHCQKEYSCDCRNALSIISVDSLVTLFNNQHQSQNRLFISEKYDQTPFVFLVKRKDVESLNGKQIKIQLKMSNGDLIEGISNELIMK